MTLEETIKNYEKVAEEKEKQAIWVWSKEDNSYYEDCIKVVKKLRQLAEWLRELKGYRTIRNRLSQNRIATDRYGDVVLWSDIERVFEEGNNADSD